MIQTGPMSVLGLQWPFSKSSFLLLYFARLVRTSHVFSQANQCPSNFFFFLNKNKPLLPAGQRILSSFKRKTLISSKHETLTTLTLSNEHYQRYFTGEGGQERNATIFEDARILHTELCEIQRQPCQLYLIIL